MTDLITAAKQALEALGKWSCGQDMDAVELNDLIAVLEAALVEEALQRLTDANQEIEAALAQEEQEPVACPYCKCPSTLGAVYYDQNCAACVKRMTAPHQRKPLTTEEMRRIALDAPLAERAHGIGVTGLEDRMSREVCGVCWGAYDDKGRCECNVNPPEPVAWVDHDQLLGLKYDGHCNLHAWSNEAKTYEGLAPLYTHPITRTLTDEVIADLWHANGGFHHHFARAIERWLKGDHA